MFGDVITKYNMYKKLYKDIIDNAVKCNRIKHAGEYFESHHIVPDFMFKNRKRKGPAGHIDGNPNEASNKVLLTFREHLMCHYYLYEIFKDTHYKYSAGSALQFFFIKATGLHARQVVLDKNDTKFLDEMAHLREIGIASISASRKGKMPVIDSITREKIGMVAVNHPNVLNKKWVHHSTGTKSPNSGRNQQGSNNANYRAMSEIDCKRIYKCISASIIDTNRILKKELMAKIKLEFTEYKKISAVWLCNHYGSISNLVEKYNVDTTSNINYDSYYRSVSQRKLAAEFNMAKKTKVKI